MEKDPFRLRSKPYMAHVRTFGCLSCGRPASAHHLQRAQGGRGLGQKVGDQWTVPLCPECHGELHAFGNESLWWANLGVDAEAWARESYGEWERARK